MKKIFIGFITGALFMTAGSAFAEEVVKNFIGRTIQGQYPVNVDGEYIENPALVVDGTSYLPVREFAQAVGYKVYFDPEGEIHLERITDPVALSQSIIDGAKEAAAHQAWMDEQTRIKNELYSSKLKIESLKEKIKSEEYRLNEFTRVVNEFKPLPGIPDEENESSKAKWESRVKETQAAIEALKAEIANLETQIPILEAQIQDTP